MKRATTLLVLALALMGSVTTPRAEEGDLVLSADQQRVLEALITGQEEAISELREQVRQLQIELFLEKSKVCI